MGLMWKFLTPSLNDRVMMPVARERRQGWNRGQNRLTWTPTISWRLLKTTLFILLSSENHSCLFLPTKKMRQLLLKVRVYNLRVLINAPWRYSWTWMTCKLLCWKLKATLRVSLQPVQHRHARPALLR